MTSPTYYDRPVLKEPVWIWTVPVYMTVAGAGAAAAVIGAVARASGRPGMRELSTWGRRLAAAGQALGVPLLIADLGRPSRFLNMLRVFRPTSPLSVGSWVLAASVPLTGVSTVLDGSGAGDAAAAASAALGLPLAGYTGVLLANTAIPVWQGSRRTLPAVFVGGSVAAAGSALALAPMGREAREAAERFAVAGKAFELAGIAAMHAEASSAGERVGRPYRSGVSGAVLTAGTVVTAAGLVLSLLRRARTTASLLGIAGSLAVRTGVFLAGWSSARDPRATFEPQRRQIRVRDDGAARP